MSLDVVGLSPLLQIIYASKSRQNELLRRKIYSARKKAAGVSTSTGGDFYVPFWADVKKHVSGKTDLRVSTAERIAKSKQVTRLYNLLTKSFLTWWEENRRQRNEPFTVIPENIIARIQLEGLGIVKVENTLSITVGDDGHRIFYPYLCEEPALSDEAARLGLWVMSQAINGYALKDMRLLDVMQGRSFSILETPLRGDEENRFRAKYREAIDAWESLKKRYD
jgi:hypothetical protein